MLENLNKSTLLYSSPKDLLLKSFKKISLLPFVVIVSVLLTSCFFTRYHVKVDAISVNTTEKNRKFIILSGSEDIDNNSLEFKQYAKLLSKSLILKGWNPSTLETADNIVFLSYQIGDRIITKREKLTTSDSDSAFQKGFARGYNARQNIDITYLREVEIRAVAGEDYRKNKEFNEVWQTKIVSRGSSDDLRGVFPYLLRAALPYMGKNTDKQVEINVPANDELAKQIAE